MENHSENLELENGLDPPSAVRVAKRALVLASCACRASLEAAPTDPETQELHADLLRWIDQVGIRDEFEPQEWSPIAAPLGELTERIVIDFTWRAEAMAVLASALCRIDLPAYDQLVDGRDVSCSLNFLDDAAEQLVAAPMLRPYSEREWIADLTLTVHWRLREYSLRPWPIDFVSFAANCQWADMPIEHLRIKRSDLALRDKPIYKCRESILIECMSIARERHQAANWLVGNEPVWSMVTCDT